MRDFFKDNYHQLKQNFERDVLAHSDDQKLLNDEAVMKLAFYAFAQEEERHNPGAYQKNNDERSNPHAGDLINAQRILTKNDAVRKSYNNQVSQIGPYDNDLRNSIRDSHLKKTPPELRWAIPKHKGPNKGSVGHANRTNPKATLIAKTGGNIGKGLGVLGLGLAAKDIADAENKERAALANALSIGGAYLGGIGGAVIGGPVAPLTGPAGAASGGYLGYELGEYLYDIYDEY